MGTADRLGGPRASRIAPLTGKRGPELLLRPGPFGCQPRKAQSSRTLATGRGSCLVDLLVARRGVRGARVDCAINLIELEVVCGRDIREEVDLVLRVAGLGQTLDVRALVGV